MKRTWSLAVMVAAGFVVTSCQKIVEELPARPTAIASTVPIPVIVVPVPVPAPANPQPSQPNPSRPVDTTPAPPPSQPKPPKDPAPAPPSGGTGIVRVGAKVFFVECGGGMIPGSEHSSEVELGCRIHYDCQGKTADNQPVNPRNTPSWTFSPASAVRVNNTTDFTPTAVTKERGVVCAYAVMDGVKSNDVCVNVR
jgi:hypothetical protein